MERTGRGLGGLHPCAAFKNAHSAYFSRRPFRLVLPDLGDLYLWIERYIDRHRPALLRGSADPGAFFVKTVKRTSSRHTTRTPIMKPGG